VAVCRWQQGRVPEGVAVFEAARQCAHSLAPAAQLAQRAGIGRTKATAAARIIAQRIESVGRTTWPTMLELSQAGWASQAGLGAGVVGQAVPDVFSRFRQRLLRETSGTA